MLITLEEATTKVNQMPFPAVEEGDTVWLEDYEFVLTNGSWIYNEKYRIAETNTIHEGYPA